MALRYEFRLRWQSAEGRQISYTLQRDKNSVGRHEDSDIRIDSTQVSRHHAIIIRGEDQCFIEDLNSANGTEVNGERLPPNETRPLPRDAEIRFADTVVRFEQRRIDVEEGRGWEPERSKSAGNRLYPLVRGAYPYGYQLLKYLPDLYQPSTNGFDDTLIQNSDNFIARFLGIFDSILLPLEWTIDNFDLFLYPDIAPVNFLPWLSNWFGVRFDSTWSEEQRRVFLREAHLLVARRGTRWALERVLEIYTGSKPIIEDVIPKKPFYFQVQLPSKHRDKQQLIESIVNAYKPVNTTYTLEFI